MDWNESYRHRQADTLDLGCVKTCAHEKCAELFSLLSCPDNRRQRFWYNVATTCHVLQHAKSPLRVALAVGQREHRELATQRCVILQAGIASDGAQSSGGLRQAGSQANAGPTAHSGQNGNALLPIMLVSRDVSDDAGRCLELEEFLAGVGIGCLEVTPSSVP